MLCYALNGITIAITETVISKYANSTGYVNYVTDGKGTLYGYDLGYNKLIPGTLAQFLSKIRDSLIRTIELKDGETWYVSETQIGGIDESFPKILVCSNESLEITQRKLSEIFATFTNEESGEISVAFFNEVTNLNYGSRESILEGYFNIDRSNEIGLPVLTVGSDWFPLTEREEPSVSERVEFPSAFDLSFTEQPLHLDVKPDPAGLNVNLNGLAVASQTKMDEAQFQAIMQLALDTKDVAKLCEGLRLNLDSLNVATGETSSSNASIVNKINSLERVNQTAIADLNLLKTEVSSQISQLAEKANNVQLRGETNGSLINDLKAIIKDVRDSQVIMQNEENRKRVLVNDLAEKTKTFFSKPAVVVATTVVASLCGIKFLRWTCGK